jgi:hypothetical protein
MFSKSTVVPQIIEHRCQDPVNIKWHSFCIKLIPVLPCAQVISGLLAIPKARKYQVNSCYAALLFLFVLFYCWTVFFIVFILLFPRHSWLNHQLQKPKIWRAELTVERFVYFLNRSRRECWSRLQSNVTLLPHSMTHSIYRVSQTVYPKWTSSSQALLRLSFVFRSSLL